MHTILPEDQSVVTQKTQDKLIQAINEAPDCSADYFYVNSKKKILLLKNSLLNELLYLNINKEWVSAKSLSDVGAVLYTISDDIFQKTKYSIKDHSFTSEEESTITIESVTIKDDEDITSKKENKIVKEQTEIEEDFNVFDSHSILKEFPDDFSDKPLMFKNISVFTVLYSMFDPDFNYYGSIENEQKYTLSYKDNTWSVETNSLDTTNIIVSFSKTIMLNIANHLNSKSVTLNQLFNISNINQLSILL